MSHSPDASGAIEYTAGCVLVVDDEPVNRELLRDLLEAQGHRVVEAEDGEEALQQVTVESPDVVLLDVMMPGLDGFDVCRRLKQAPETASVPVLIVTALNQRGERLRGMEVGANDFLTKPIDQQDVLLRVRNAIHAKQLHDRVGTELARVRELETLRDDLVHLMVHDMRSPLMGISGYLEVVLEDAHDGLNEESRGHLAACQQSAERLTRIVTAMLDVSRLEAGEMPLAKQDVDLRDVVAEGLESLGSLTRECEVRSEVPAAPVRAVCDPEVVRRVVANIVGNAIGFTRKEGTVRIELTGEEGSARVAVSDMGPGIPEEYRARIFDKFGQVASRRDGRKYSTGLGLAFCKLAVEAHGGRIGVESEEGHGSTFWFVLPEGDGTS